MTATAIDAAITFAYIAPNELNHFYSKMYDGGFRGPPPPILSGFLKTNDLSDVRLGVMTEWFNDSQPEVRKICDEALAFLKSRGATVVEISIPHLQWMSLSHGIKISSEFAMLWDEYYSQWKSDMDDYT